MNKQDVKKILYNQVPLKILSFLSLHPGKVFSAHEISQQADSSKGATHQTLKTLLGLDILHSEKKGNLFLYKLNPDNFLVKEFKIFENLLNIHDLVKNIKPYCYQIVLFGSCSDGTNFQGSDLDLFIKTDFYDKVRNMVNDFSHKKGFHISAAIQTPLEIADAKKEDKIFYEQVKKGITLWEGRPENEGF